MLDSSLLTLIFFLLAGGGKDLVSYIPPEAYWQSKGVEVVTVDALLSDVAANALSIDLDKTINALGSDDPAAREAAAKALLAAGSAALEELEKESTSPDVEVARRAKALVAQIRTEAKPREIRRLMAIRSLGDLKDAKALPALKLLTASTDPFIAEYAAEAVAKIEGKPAPAHSRDAKKMAADLELLPASCAVVMQLQPKPGLTPPLVETIDKVELGEAGRRAQLNQISSELIATAERLGNLRIDGVTLGVSGDFNVASGFIVAVVRGQYDPALVAVAAREEKMPATPVDGQMLYQWGPESQVFFPSSDRLVYLASMDPQQVPATEMVANVAKGKGTIRANADLAKLIDATDASQPFWGVAKLTPTLRAATFFDGVDVVRLSGTQENDKVEFTLSASGTDPARLQAAAKAAGSLVKEPLADLEKYAAFMPPLRLARDFLKSVHFKTGADGTVTGGATWTGSITRLYGFSTSPYTLPVDLPK